MSKSAIKLKLKGKYECLSALYSAMITHDFTAGFPLLHGEGVYSQIAFPELDRNNQVQICRNAFTGSYWVLRVTSSAGNVLNNALLDAETDGMSSMSAAFGETKRECLRLVKVTAEEIEKIGL